MESADTNILTLVTVDKIRAATPARKNWRMIDKVIGSPNKNRDESFRRAAIRIGGALVGSLSSKMLNGIEK
jgi:hypothetical protein